MNPKPPELLMASDIQPHGVLLVCRRRDHCVVQCSSNVVEILGIPLPLVLGYSMDTLLSPQQAAFLSSELEALDSRSTLRYMPPTRLAATRRLIGVSAYRTDSYYVIELE